MFSFFILNPLEKEEKLIEELLGVLWIMKTSCEHG